MAGNIAVWFCCHNHRPSTAKMSAGSMLTNIEMPTLLKYFLGLFMALLTDQLKM